LRAGRSTQDRLFAPARQLRHQSARADATTGRIGTFIQKFVVPNLEKEKTWLPISTVV
jgi:hypothetical protein